MLTLAKQVITELLSQAVFQDLARGAQRDGIDEDYVVRDPPSRDFAIIEGAQLRTRQLSFWFLDNDQQGALIPFGMLRRDARRLRYCRMGHGDVLQFNRTYPFAP
jgi:hypothetical protein